MGDSNGYSAGGSKDEGKGAGDNNSFSDGCVKGNKAMARVQVTAAQRLCSMKNNGVTPKKYNIIERITLNSLFIFMCYTPSVHPPILTNSSNHIGSVAIVDCCSVVVPMVVSVHHHAAAVSLCSCLHSQPCPRPPILTIVQ
jgi:hypothetical protein